MKILARLVLAAALTLAPMSLSSNQPDAQRECPGSGSYCRTVKGRAYYIGPRGGCFYCNSNGNKTYVDRSVCDGC